MNERELYEGNTLFYQTEKENNMAENKMNVYQKLSKARVMLQSKNLKKTGKNAYAGFSYFELKDFLPSCNEIFNEVGLVSNFRCVTTVGVDGQRKETAFLEVINADEPTESIIFSSDTAEPLQIDKSGTVKQQNPIQQLGSKHTYMRRYLYLEAMEIVEDDTVDATIDKDDDKPIKKDRAITKEQTVILQKLCEENPDRAMKMLEHYKVDSITNLTLTQASEAIKTLKQEVQ